jgi:hypothetical protein
MLPAQRDQKAQKAQAGGVWQASLTSLRHIHGLYEFCLHRVHSGWFGGPQALQEKSPHARASARNHITHFAQVLSEAIEWMDADTMYTIFAPHDQAITQFPHEQERSAWIKAHVVVGIWIAADLMDIGRLTNLNGDVLGRDPVKNHAPESGVAPR